MKRFYMICSILFELAASSRAQAQYLGLRKRSTLNVPMVETSGRALTELVYIGEKNDDDVADQFPLSLCQGDCDDDDDCIDSLVCFNRADGGPNPPGCTGVPSGGRDYCYDPNTPPPTAPDSTQPPTPSTNETPPPTTSNNTPPPTPSPTDTEMNFLVVLDQNGLSDLTVCQGDCDDDSDCVGSLECFQRSTGDPGPLGCAGEPVSDRDYCYDPSYSEPDETPPPTTATLGGPAPTAPTLAPTIPPNSLPTTAPTPYPTIHIPANGPFKLRLYWSPEFYWQETTEEAFWCIECGYGQDCWEGDHLILRFCDDVPTEFKFLDLPSGNGKMISHANRDLCITVAHLGRLELKPCVGNENQIWEAGEGGFDEDKFDIRPSGDDDKCMSNHHHPKSGEEVRASTDCTRAHLTETGFWERWS